MYMTHIIILLSNSVPDIFNRDLNHWHPDYLGLGNWRKATKIWNMPQNKDSKVRLFPTPRLPIVPPSQRPWYLWTASHNSFWKQKVGMANVFMTGVILLESPKMTLAMTSCHCLKINHPPTPIWHIVPAYVKDSRNGLDSCLEFIQEIAKKKKKRKKKKKKWQNLIGWWMRIPGLGSSPGEGIGYQLQCSWASLVAQMVKNLPTMWETWVQSLGWEDPLEEGIANHSRILAWRIPMERGSWRATVHGVVKSQTWLSAWTELMDEEWRETERKNTSFQRSEKSNM